MYQQQWAWAATSPGGPHPPSEHGKNLSIISHLPSTLHTNVFCGSAYPKAMQSKAFWQMHF